MGRPRREHNPQAQECWIPQVNHILHESQPSHSPHKNVYKLQCKCPKHCAYVSVRSWNWSPTARCCHVCEGGGSQPERLLYEVLDAMDVVQLYAVESYSLVQKKSVCLEDGTVVHPNLKRWDATILHGHGLLVELQGEGHSSKLVTRPNNTEDTIPDRQLKDRGYAEAAVKQGWSVLWVWVDDTCPTPRKRALQWAAQLRQALSHVVAGGQPQLFDNVNSPCN